MGIFISVQKTVECVVCAVLFAAAFAATCYKPAGILQSLGYSGKKLFLWAGKRGNAIIPREILLFMACALIFPVCALCFAFAGEWAAIIALVPSIMFFIVYVFADRRALRSPATFTPRFKRLYVVLAFLCAVLSYIFITLLNFADFVWGNEIFSLLRYLPLTVFPLLTLPIVALSNCICCIYEIPKNRGYIKRAKAKLAASKTKVIGITGSYAKTSVKNILSHILSGKYKVLSTPRSHNTPLGIAMTLNGAELENYDFFIAEMGARHVGDIAELSEMCPPDYSIITGICPQHLESFKTEQNIVKAKGEILAATSETAVIAPDAYSLFEAYPCAKLKGEEPKDIICSPEGMEFTLVLGGEERRVKSRLLGRHSAENIALAATAAHVLGMSADEIAQRIEGIDFTEHRLQLTVSGGVNILDDGYNSNIRGAAAALEVLRSFGGRKIVVTPGLVELGVLEESENFALGENLAGLDYVLLVGETLIAPVKKGYLQNGGDAQKLKVVPTLKEAQKELAALISEGDAVLFLNDLPDIYL